MQKPILILFLFAAVKQKISSGENSKDSCFCYSNEFIKYYFGYLHQFLAVNCVPVLLLFFQLFCFKWCALCFVSIIINVFNAYFNFTMSSSFDSTKATICLFLRFVFHIDFSSASLRYYYFDVIEINCTCLLCTFIGYIAILLLTKEFSI